MPVTIPLQELRCSCQTRLISLRYRNFSDTLGNSPEPWGSTIPDFVLDNTTSRDYEACEAAVLVEVSLGIIFLLLEN